LSIDQIIIFNETDTTSL